MRLACSTRSFPLDNLKLSLARIQWAGCDAAEVTLDDRADAEEGDAVKAALERNEMELSAVDGGALEFASREQALEAAARLGKCVLLAQQADGRRVVFRVPDGTREWVAYGLRQLATVMPGYDVALCPVNGPGPLTAPEDFEELGKRLEGYAAADRLGLALDPAAALAEGWDAPEFVHAAETSLRYVYLSDRRGGQPALPGAGEIDWPELIAALRADGYDGFLSLLLQGADPLTAESDAKEVCAFMKALIHSAY